MLSILIRPFRQWQLATAKGNVCTLCKWARTAPNARDYKALLLHHTWQHHLTVDIHLCWTGTAPQLGSGLSTSIHPFSQSVSQSVKSLHSDRSINAHSQSVHLTAVRLLSAVRILILTAARIPFLTVRILLQVQGEYGCTYLPAAYSPYSRAH